MLPLLSNTAFLTSKCRSTAPKNLGSEVHFAASLSLLVSWESQLTSALSLAQVWGRYRGRVAPSGLPPKKLSASIKHTLSFVLANTTKTAARQ
jgi:hypothetical protein